MFRSRKKKTYSEQLEQIEFFDYLKLAHKKYVGVCFSVPNEGKRTYACLNNLMQAGLTPGVPDVFCAIPNKHYSGLFIEFKYGKGKLSEYQEKMIPALSDMGYRCDICYSSEDAIKIFNEYVSNIGNI